jgi:hypothetical protein
MRYPTRASEPVHRRLWVPPSPLHDPSAQELHDESSWRGETVRCVLDWGHQNGMVRPCSPTQPAISWPEAARQGARHVPTSQHGHRHRH